MMHTRIFSRCLWTILLALLITACGGAETPTPISQLPPPTATTAVATLIPPTATTAVDSQPPGTGTGQVFLENLQVNLLESFPIQVEATLSGNLSDGCTRLAETAVQRQDTTFTINLVTTRDEQAACTQALVPFTQTVAFDVQGLPAGTYTVIAGNLSQTFTLVVDNVPAPTPDLGSASLTVATTTAHPGDTVQLTGTAFPANIMVQIGIGPVNSEYDIIGSAQTGADGSFTTQVTVPTYVGSGQWVFVAETDNAIVLANPITIEKAEGNVGVPVAGVNVPVNGLFNRTYIYLIALEDGGQGGPLVGCNDSAIPVVIDIEPTVAPLTAAITRLLNIDEQYYGESGLYNALYQSDLTLDGINIVNHKAILSLSGSLQLGGACDDPRLLAQLEQTALQYSTVDAVSIMLNGQPLVIPAQN